VVPPDHRSGKGNPEEQERTITDWLVRWATRDGEDATQAAAAIRSVLDEHLAGRYPDQSRRSARTVEGGRVGRGPSAFHAAVQPAGPTGPPTRSARGKAG